jgi:hypothetical protein
MSMVFVGEAFSLDLAVPPRRDSHRKDTISVTAQVARLKAED